MDDARRCGFFRAPSFLTQAKSSQVSMSQYESLSETRYWQKVSRTHPDTAVRDRISRFAVAIRSKSPEAADVESTKPTTLLDLIRSAAGGRWLLFRRLALHISS